MMPVIDWLRERLHFNLLQDELQEIRDFALLYSLFEAKALAEDGRPAKIIEAVERWQADGRLQDAPFQASVEYFSQRYFPGGEEDQRFGQLCVAPTHRQRVAHVLSGMDAPTSEKVIALLLVVNRLRNNLMHGPKWAYNLAGQGENFAHANLALMAALDCNGMDR